MSFSKIDLFYRKFVFTKFYPRGWGKPEELKQILQKHKLISNREICSKLVSPSYEVHIDKELKHKDCTILKGHFVTPMLNILPNLIPKAAQVAHFEVVLPKTGITESSYLKPACIHMAGTGDHGFSRRRELLAKPLLKSGIVSVLLENPYYGVRKPKEQFASGLLKVSDLFIMGSCLILEAQVLLHWLKRSGYGPLGLTGISMGGHMASLAATNWPEPIALIPCLSWTSASVVWTEGVLSKAIPWRVLETQYACDAQYERDILNLLKGIDSVTVEEDFTGDSISRFEKAVTGHRNRDKLEQERRQRATIQFMKGVMDHVTHLGNFSCPVDTSTVTFVCAKGDAYFPRSNLTPMDQLWPGCEIREINAGHVAGCVMHYPDFVRAIVDTFARLVEKHHTNLLTDQENNSNNSCEEAAAKMTTTLSTLKAFDTRALKPNLAFSLGTWLRAIAVKS